LTRLPVAISFVIVKEPVCWPDRAGARIPRAWMASVVPFSRRFGSTASLRIGVCEFRRVAPFLWMARERKPPITNNITTEIARLRAVLEWGGPASSGGFGRKSDCAAASGSSVFTPLRNEGMQKLHLQHGLGCLQHPSSYGHLLSPKSAQSKQNLWFSKRVFRYWNEPKLKSCN